MLSYDAGGGAQRRAIAEAAITFSLSHPNVVATYHHDIKPLKIVEGGSNGEMQVTGQEGVQVRVLLCVCVRFLLYLSVRSVFVLFISLILLCFLFVST